MAKPDSTLAQRREEMHSREKYRYNNSPTFDTTESVIQIPMRDGHLSETRVFKPQSTEKDAPLVVLIFGGGFISGSNIQLAHFARAVAKLYAATTVTLSYRLAPGYKFPTAAYDIWDGVSWLAENAAREIGNVDLSKGFVIGGVSAGGNLAIVTAHKALKERLAAPLTGIWACIPATLSDDTVPEQYKELFTSRVQNAKAPLLNAQSIEVVKQLYQPDESSPDYTPFTPDGLGSFSQIPRTHVQVAGLDPLRDDGLIYERVLRDHGVETRLDVYPGVPHAHFSAMPGLKASYASRRDTLLGIGWLLRQEVDVKAVEGVEEAWEPALLGAVS